MKRKAKYQTSMTNYILVLLRKHKELTDKLLIDMLADNEMYPTDNSIKSTLCKMKSVGQIGMMKKSCCTCGKKVMWYHILPTGREKIAEHV